MMKKMKTENGKRIVLFLLLCCIGIIAPAQKKNQNKTHETNGLTKEELATYETEINKMVNYLQETLNFIGDPTQTAQEKEIIFSQSYTKIFQDDKVQIEDDLDTKRNANLSKDVQAYLKDIDFFFQHATFTFDVQSVANLTKDNGETYFKVTMNRKLVGITVTNDTINEVKIRYMEINLDKAKNDLKIASIYTTKVNERESLRYWWNSMPSAWKNYFGKDVKINENIPLKAVMQVNENDFIYSYPILSVIDGDTMATEWKEETVSSGLDALYGKLKSLSMTQEVDVANVRTITTLEPLNELSELSVLNITGTNVNDLTPLRNANKLKVLKAGNTRIEDLSPLKYDIMLEELDISNTDVNNIEVIEILDKLEKLNINHTQVSNLKPIENCPNLEFLFADGSKIKDLQVVGNLEKITSLNISNTAVRDLTPISNLKSLHSLKISNTPITNLNVLSEIDNLKELYCSNTSISDLTPLKNHRKLSKIYCDNTRIDNSIASEFTKTNPFTLVIYDTNALSEWWDSLPIFWTAVFAKQVNIEGKPTTEQLHEVINMTDLDLSGNLFIQNLLPVSRLTNLVNLNISNTEITFIEPLAGMTHLENINLESTYVKSLKPLEDMKNLKTLNINNTPIESLEPLWFDSHLEVVLANGTAVTEEQVNLLRMIQPNVTVVYQTEALRTWWEQLDEEWQSLLKSQISCNSYEPTDMDLQRIVNITEFRVERENQIQDLNPIKNFYWLEKVNIANQGIRDITPLANKSFLRELQLQNNPINDLSALVSDTLLAVLNVENTQVSDLSKLEKTKYLRVLNASGTGIKSLKPLSKMTTLEELLINNTGVKSISPIENIPSLKLLKIYNTKVKSKHVKKLQQKRFDLNIVYY